MLHLSSAVLSKNVTEPKSKSYVTVTMRGSDASKTLKNLTIAVLTPDKNEMQPLDIYCNISQDVTISCQGKNEVHMAGYFVLGANITNIELLMEGLGALKKHLTGQNVKSLLFTKKSLKLILKHHQNKV